MPDRANVFTAGTAPVELQDATTSVKGLVQLAGDLAGTAAAPTVPGLAGKAASVHTHAVSDLTATGTPSASTYLRGDGSWATPAGTGAVDSVNGQTGAVTLDAADVGAAESEHTHGVADIDATGTPGAATYLRGDGTWATPAGGGGGATVTWVTLATTAQAITLPAPTQGAQLIVVLTQDATGGRTADWPADVIWEGDATPSVPAGPSERAVFTLLGTADDTWLGFTSGMFAGPVVPDTTEPTPGTLAGSMVTASSFRLTVSGASDNLALAPLPYRFSNNNGGTWSAWQVDPVYDVSGLAADTAYTCIHQTRDAALNQSTGASITVTTMSAAVPAITDSFNRANSTTGLGVTDTGQTWQQVGTGIVGIIGGAAYRASSNASAVVDFGQADMWVTQRVVVTGDYFAGFSARRDGNNNEYSVQTSSAGGTGAVKVMRVINGSFTGVPGAIIPALANGDTIGVSFKEVGGSTEIKTYRNGVLQNTSTDSTAGRPMGTVAGISPYNNPSIRIDDFSVQVPE